MTERYGSGHGDEGGQRPSGRGAVTERLGRRDQGAREIDLTDEAVQRDGDDETDQADRESSGAFEPAAPTADPPAGEDRPGSSSIFDVDERAKQEELNPTGYEPPVAEADGDPEGPRGETVVTEPGEPREPREEAAGQPASLLGSLDAADIRNRFVDIQAGFVDEPRQAVEEAGRFVDDLVGQVADALQRQRGQLAGATAEGSTEDLRLTLRAYRQFVDRILGLAN